MTPLSPDPPHLEVRTMTVDAAHEQQMRGRMAAAGWKFQYRIQRADGSITLAFARRKASMAERES